MIRSWHIFYDILIDGDLFISFGIFITRGACLLRYLSRKRIRSLSCRFVWYRGISNSDQFSLLLLLLLFFRLKSTCSLRLWCFTHHATSSFGTSIMVGFVYLLLAYL